MTTKLFKRPEVFGYARAFFSVRLSWKESIPNSAIVTISTDEGENFCEVKNNTKWVNQGSRIWYILIEFKRNYCYRSCFLSRLSNNLYGGSDYQNQRRCPFAAASLIVRIIWTEKSLVSDLRFEIDLENPTQPGTAVPVGVNLANGTVQINPHEHPKLALSTRYWELSFHISRSWSLTQVLNSTRNLKECR